MTSIHADDEVRVIESAAPPTRFARGWHCLGPADSFRDGKPHAVMAFGTKLVVFADSEGKLHVLNGYCPHMGGDLSRGTVKGDAVACPFHDWRWAGNGRCASIPYARRVPPLARTKAWTTLERSGQLFIWHDPQGNPPPPEVTIPELAPADDGSRWTPLTWNAITIEDSHSREIVDNVVDMAHFFYVHFSFPVYFKNVFEGHVAIQHMKSKARPDADMGTSYSRGDDAVNRGEATYYGPSYMIARSWRPSPDGEIEVALVTCHYPVTSTSFVLQWGVTVKKLPSLTDEQANGMAQAFAKGVERGFMQDVEIWRNKTKIDNPLLCEEDGPVYQLRRWYEQFYTDVEDVTPEMIQRFEYEIDTERANTFWNKEVEENLAAGRFITSDPNIDSVEAALGEQENADATQG